jgi:hypothetical protein
MNFWLKIFIFIIAGYILRRQNLIPDKVVKFFIGAAVYFFIPLFILMAAWANTSAPAEMVKIGGVAVGVIAVGALYALFFVKSIVHSRKKIPFRNVCLTFMFMNSAYMSIPVNSYYFGAEGTTFAVIYNIVATVLFSTVGIWFVGKKGISEIFRIPFVYAAAAGLALNFANVPRPAVVIELTNIMKTYALPAMLTFAGYQINLANTLKVRLAISGAAFRMLGGFAAGFLIALALGLKGNAFGTAVIASCMPPAVNSYIMAEKYSADPEFAATAVFIGTIASFFIIPAAWEIVKNM